MLPEILSQRYLTGVVREYPVGAFIGLQILGLQPVPGMKTMWDVIMEDAELAPFIAMDAESELADKADVKRGFSELADIRIKERLDEEDLLNLRMPGEPDVVTGLALTQRTTAEQKVLQTMDRMGARVWGRVEWSIWQALSLGTITYNDKKVNFAVDFGVPANQKITLTSTACWSDTTNSDPISDINTWIELQTAASGRVPTRMVVGNNIPKYLVNNAKIRALLQANGQIERLISVNSVLGYIGSILGLKIERYATHYQASKNAAKSYFLDPDTLVMLPDPVQSDGEKLGDTATGPAKANNFDTGIYAWAKEEEDPWVTFVGAGIHAFPRIMHPTWILNVRVKS